MSFDYALSNLTPPDGRAYQTLGPRERLTIAAADHTLDPLVHWSSKDTSSPENHAIAFGAVVAMEPRMDGHFMGC